MKKDIEDLQQKVKELTVQVNTIDEEEEGKATLLSKYVSKSKMEISEN